MIKLIGKSLFTKNLDLFTKSKNGDLFTKNLDLFTKSKNGDLFTKNLEKYFIW